VGVTIAAEGVASGRAAGREVRRDRAAGAVCDSKYYSPRQDENAANRAE